MRLVRNGIIDYKDVFLNSYNYERILFEKLEQEQVEEKLEKDEIEIMYLIGQRGKIQDKEYKEQIVGF